ncbi:YdcF family protein [Paenibacillus tarimensis]|uniref:YdcF family protein n=1 Tax=Paenibacillus tarimensis TaxID=416012 RepID=UPI001F3DACF1|nr:YdcF family protein [Paenibacillus tarimensis]MCF2942658.1 YdcF family protein [Paenibacillus tarimensis]
MKSKIETVAAVQTAGLTRGQRLRRLVVRTALAIVLLFVIWVGYLLWIINRFDPGPVGESYDAGIVLGASLWHDVPSPGLRERLDHALKLYEEGRFETFILTGGYGGVRSRLAEAEGMRNYLLERGVPESDILLETTSTSTYDNLLNSKAIMRENDINKVVIITHEFHSARAYDIARYLDYQDPDLSPAKSVVVPELQQQPREVLAFTKWKIDSVLLKFGLRLPDN